MRGSGARYEGPRHVESLEAFYREKLAEDANVHETLFEDVSLNLIFLLARRTCCQQTSCD